MTDKKTRALRIYHAARKLDIEHGAPYASRGPDAAGMGRLVEVAPYRIRFSPNCRRALVRCSETATRDIVQLRNLVTLFEVDIYGEPQLAVNIGDDQDPNEVEIHRFLPGDWEKFFEVDPEGDTVPILPFIFAHPKDPHWQAFMRSPDGQWPRPTA